MNSLVRYSLKAGALAGSLFAARQPPGITYLIYHKVGGELPLDIDLPLPLFRRQLTALAETGRVVAYDRALALLEEGRPLADDLFVLTFDDGYEDFYSQVLPVLDELKLPAILFVTTGFIEESVAYPFSDTNIQARPLTWDMLARLQASGLVTLAAHTHTHPNLVGLPPEQLEEELSRPLHLFQDRLGFTPEHFAYPRAIWDEAAERLVRCYYRSAVIATGQKAVSPGFNPYRIPRLPIRTSDGWLFFKAKLRGWLQNEEKFYSLLHHYRQNTLGRLNGQGR
jgi:peptidoglycan/xylan/chitin deacetylase (PgdA/CDA1 family)